MILITINVIAHVRIIIKLTTSLAYFFTKLITYPPADLQSYYLANLLAYYPSNILIY